MQVGGGEITLDVSVGDVILGGRFKNKKQRSKSKDEHGIFTINGRKVVILILKLTKKLFVIKMDMVSTKNLMIVILTNLQKLKMNQIKK